MTTFVEQIQEAGKLLDRVIYKSLEMLIEKWHMNNGSAGFAEFYATHPACRFDERTLEEMVSIKSLTLFPFAEIVIMITDDNFVDMKPKNLWKYAKQNRSEIIACASDTWIQEQYRRWFEGHDRFLTVCQYHLADDEKLFFNWLIRK